MYPLPIQDGRQIQFWHFHIRRRWFPAHHRDCLVSFQSLDTPLKLWNSFPHAVTCRGEDNREKCLKVRAQTALGFQTTSSRVLFTAPKGLAVCPIGPGSFRWVPLVRYPGDIISANGPFTFIWKIGVRTTSDPETLWKVTPFKKKYYAKEYCSTVYLSYNNR